MFYIAKKKKKKGFTSVLDTDDVISVNNRVIENGRM